MYVCYISGGRPRTSGRKPKPTFLGSDFEISPSSSADAYGQNLGDLPQMQPMVQVRDDFF